ncbi:AAA family ATPase [Ursidibacter maritimus]|uniref:AAA family ATPase n=1 Tax=Ursidibacter maritimus TaxID=1331689 RepID=A0A949WNL6_9PAST|nr:ATP-binding protein [Ursidibacter maritimus]KAE9541374.1 hypothetical protein A1D26_00235 [Ursidibacter maritimus]MBV6524777.1 AAA family ATPase [Ursidibacter maritimus]MBV6526477.1 AAA family ATPase [Ursidibacter maritimus]MBV6527119.1 AAA family ATPase [Ursidibacter maritimus]MBV6529046.1 AAA family ATPase [Ursidibacter maritimus]
MIKSLKLVNVGPMPNLDLELGNRLNILTGDNGLGKSFLLDIMWWSLTRSWPQNINPKIQNGYVAKPIDLKNPAEIRFSLLGKTQREKSYEATYSPRDEIWVGKAGRPINPGLVIYSMSDGSFALWDPARNYWRNIWESNHDSGMNDKSRPAAYVYSQLEIWEGAAGENGKERFSGLLYDWALWQSGNSEYFLQLQSVLKSLSTREEPLVLGKLRRFSLDDDRLYPTIKTTYGQEVLLPHASSGIKRIVALAYFLVHAWKKHCENAELIGETPTNQITFLIDEVEAHLHPKWQRQIIPAILKVMTDLSKNATTQLVTATHSPLIMASLEPLFKKAQDLWIDFDLLEGKIEVRQEPFTKLGSVNNWLESEAFNLQSSYALEYEQLIDEARELISSRRNMRPTNEQIENMREKLANALEPTDPFLFYWRSICEKKGYLKRVEDIYSSRTN